MGGFMNFCFIANDYGAVVVPVPESFVVFVVVVVVPVPESFVVFVVVAVVLLHVYPSPVKPALHTQTPPEPTDAFSSHFNSSYLVFNQVRTATPLGS